jgi:hypothetical protein
VLIADSCVVGDRGRINIRGRNDADHPVGSWLNSNKGTKCDMASSPNPFFKLRFVSSMTRGAVQPPPLHPEKLEADQLLDNGQLSPTKPGLAAQRFATKSKRGIMPESVAYVLEQILR